MICNAEAPHLEKLRESVRSRGGEIVGISLANDRPEGARKFRERHRLRYPIVFDREDRFDHEKTEVPSTVLVDSAGVVRWMEEGFDPDEFPALEKRFRALLPAGRGGADGPPPPPRAPN